MEKTEMVKSDQLEEMLRRGLERREMPDCFLYVGNTGGDSWLDLSESPEFPVASCLTGLLIESLPRLVPHLPPEFDLMSVGVGSGEKERMLIEGTGSHMVRRYFPVDVSAPLVDAAMQQVENAGVETRGIVAFLEDLPELRRFWSSPLLLCLLGNNFCNYRPDHLLGMVYDQLEPGDLFLFDCHLIPAGDNGNIVNALQRILDAYRSETNVRFNTAPLTNRGFPPEACRFDLELIEEPSRVGEVLRTHKRLDILQNGSVSCGEGRVDLSAGETISMGFTYKYTASQVRDYLRQYGFEEIAAIPSADGENLLALVGK